VTATRNVDRASKPAPDSLATRYRTVQERIERAARASGRSASDIILVAVSKYTGLDQIRELVQLGHRDFGENHVQALVQRAAAMDEWFGRHKQLPILKPAAKDAQSPLRWHMIGRLQRNKARKAAELCRLIHSVDNARVAEEVQIAANKLGRTVDVLLQVNTSGEESKAGVAPAAVMHVLDMLDTMINVRVRGLMTMAAHDEAGHSTDPRATFSRLRELFQEAKRYAPVTEHFNILSMGMSDDYEIAIAEGSNLVRVGSAIFGAPTHVPDETEDEGDDDDAE
jgi:hypothetical protein